MTKFKKHVPRYVLMMFFLILCTRAYSPELVAAAKKLEQKYKMSWRSELDYDWTNPPADYRTQQVMDAYIDNAVSGADRIIKNKKSKGYRGAVRAELPGAPMNPGHTWHCLYGQYTQLNRALAETGDTIQIIPRTNNAHQATSQFKQQMSKLYDNSEYCGTIHRGHLYATESEYGRALNKYLKSAMRKHKGEENNVILRNQYVRQFEKNNFCATMLNPGSIIIVDEGHAIMYLGQGKVKDNEFIPDPRGTAICCAYNGEHTAIELKTWRTNRAYAADIQKIVQHKHKQEELLAMAQIKQQYSHDNFIMNVLRNPYQR